MQLVSYVVLNLVTKDHYEYRLWNETPIEVIKEGEFGETYFGNIYSGINSKWYRKSSKEFDALKNINKTRN